MADAVPSTSSSTSSTSSSRAARASTRAAAAEARSSLVAAPLHPSLLSFHSLLEFIDVDLAGAIRLKLVAAPLPPHTTPFSSVLSLFLISSPPSLIKIRNEEDTPDHMLDIVVTIIANKVSVVLLSDSLPGVKGICVNRRFGDRAKVQLHQVLAACYSMRKIHRNLLPADVVLSLLQQADPNTSILSSASLDSTWNARISILRRIDSDDEEDEGNVEIEVEKEDTRDEQEAVVEDEMGLGRPESSASTGIPTASSSSSTIQTTANRRQAIREDPQVTEMRRSLLHRDQTIQDKNAELEKLKGVNHELKQCRLQKQQLSREMAQAEAKMRKLEEECRGYALGKIMMEKREKELSGKEASLTEKESRQREAKADLEGKIRSMEEEKEDWMRQIKQAESARDEARSEMDKTRLDSQAKTAKAEAALQAALHKAEMSEKQAENERKLREEARKQWESDEKEWREKKKDLITKLEAEKKCAVDTRRLLEVKEEEWKNEERLLVDEIGVLKEEAGKRKEQITNMYKQISELGAEVRKHERWHDTIADENLANLTKNRDAELERRRKRQAENLDKQEESKKVREE